LSTVLLEQALIGVLPATGCVAVACSGGRDSIALLHAAVHAVRGSPGLSVVALHVHHGLSSQADAWLDHVQSMCDAWAARGLPVRAITRRVHCDTVGRSVEDVARDMRYAALTEMASEAGAGAVLLAHHRRDQAETVLLQAFRGASVDGLVAMPADIERDGLRWVRPWLAHKRAAIDAYVQTHSLTFVDDDSNADQRFARNRLRHAVWSPLTAAFPQVEQALADAARRLADVQAVLDASMADLVGRLCNAGDASLDVVAWSALDASHRRLSLMYWYRQLAGASLPASWVDRLSAEIPLVLQRSKPGSWPPVGLGLYRQRLRWVANMAQRVTRLRADDVSDDEPPPDWFGQTLSDVEPIEPVCVQASLGRADELRLPEWSGWLRVVPTQQGGVPRSLLRELTLRARSGGERFQLGRKRIPRSLRKQFQEVGVPAWCRDGPLGWIDDQLVFVPGLGMDARVWADEGQPQFTLVWVPDAQGPVE
jgi:tRNA(Ile)-lysidine synthase